MAVSKAFKSIARHSPTPCADSALPPPKPMPTLHANSALPPPVTSWTRLGQPRPEHPPNTTRTSRHFKFHARSDKPRTRHLSGRHSSLYSLSPPLLHLLYDTPSFTYIPVIPLSLIIYDTLYPYHTIHSTWRATSITRHGTHLFHQTATEISAQLGHSPPCRARLLQHGTDSYIMIT